MAKPNTAGLYFVDKAGKLVDEGSPDVAQQFIEEDLRALHLGPYASATEEEQRVIYAKRKADQEAAAERERAAVRNATAPDRTDRERALEARIAELERQAGSKATTGSANKAVTSAPADKSRPVTAGTASEDR